jgi:elongation factor 1-gamma
VAAPVLRIFSYLPNPRVWKALIAAEYCGVEVETLGARPPELARWLWDFAARELSEAEMTDTNPNARVGRRGFKTALYKTDAFLVAHPFGTVPAAFDPEGKIGIFESNSILRAVARSGAGDHGLYGRNGYEASRVDSFLDAGLVFAREAQEYLLALPKPSSELYERMSGAYEFYLDGINSALGNSAYIAGEELTIADIGFACDFGQFLRERRMLEKDPSSGVKPISEQASDEFPRAYQHLLKLAQLPEFEKHITPLTRGLV